MTKTTSVEAYANGDKLIELIFSDVDGTLVNPEQQLTPRTIAAVEAASKAGVPLIIATGKALGPWMSGVLDRLPLTMQRLHMQGNYIIDPKDGVIYNRQLSPDIFDDMLAFAKEHGARVGRLGGFWTMICAARRSKRWPWTCVPWCRLFYAAKIVSMTRISHAL